MANIIRCYHCIRRIWTTLLGGYAALACKASMVTEEMCIPDISIAKYRCNNLMHVKFWKLITIIYHALFHLLCRNVFEALFKGNYINNVLVTTTLDFYSSLNLKSKTMVRINFDFYLYLFLFPKTSWSNEIYVQLQPG